MSAAPEKYYRQESYRRAILTNQQAEQELSRWRHEETLKNDIANRLRHIRETLGLDPCENSPARFIQSPNESQVLQPGKNDLENTFGKNIEDDSSISNQQHSRAEVVRPANNYQRATQHTRQQSNFLHTSLKKQICAEDDEDFFDKKYGLAQGIQQTSMNTSQLLTLSQMQIQVADEVSTVGDKLGESYSLAAVSSATPAAADKDGAVVGQLKKAEGVSEERLETSHFYQNFRRVHETGSSSRNREVTDLQRKIDLEKSEQIRALNARLREYEEALSEAQSQLEKQDLRAQELQSQVQELEFEARSRENSEKYLKTQVQNLHNQLQGRESQHNAELELLRSEIEQFRHSRDLFHSGETSDLKSFVVQLETDLSLTKSQLIECVREKGELQCRLEEAQNEVRHAALHAERELEEKYRQEIRDLHFVCDSLKKENETILNLQGPVQSQKNFAVKKTLSSTPPTQCTSKFCKRQRGLVQEYSERLTALMDEKYKLEERVEWLECQLRALQCAEKNEAVAGSAPAEVFERRYTGLKEQILFWKGKAEKLSLHYFKVIGTLREDNEKFKGSLTHTQKAFFAECERLLRDFFKIYQDENGEIREKLKAAQEKNSAQQRLISELRVKVRERAKTQTGNSEYTLKDHSPHNKENVSHSNNHFNISNNSGRKANGQQNIKKKKRSVLI